MFLDLRPRRLAAFLCVVWPALACSSCAQNIVVRQPPAHDPGYMGPFQRCARNAECKVDDTYDSSVLNDSNTQFYLMPNCPYGIHDFAVLSAGSDAAEVLVRCAAPDPARANNGPDAGGGLPVATSGGGTR